MKTETLIWWSAGITSAVAGKIAQSQYKSVRFLYIETGAAHPDNERFRRDCEKWYGTEIEIVRNNKGYASPLDVVARERYINGPEGAKCTQVLKKEVREAVLSSYQITLFNDVGCNGNVFGFEFSRKEVNRAIRFLQQNPSVGALFPLIERGLTKDNCAALLGEVGIELPTMYKLGYSNNNCIGCFKGGMGYWNKIRADFPEVFAATAAAERLVNHSCINGVFLDELPPTAGRAPKVVSPECGLFCSVDFADLEDRNLSAVLEGRISVYQAAS